MIKITKQVLLTSNNDMAKPGKEEKVSRKQPRRLWALYDQCHSMVNLDLSKPNKHLQYWSFQVHKFFIFTIHYSHKVCSLYSKKNQP